MRSDNAVIKEHKKENTLSREYCTQMEAARKGILTPEIQIVAQKEMHRESEIMELVAQGKIVIPANEILASL